MAKGGFKRAARNFPVAPFLVEVGVYGLLVTAYFFLVLHFLGGALRYLFQTNRTTYAVVALTLIVGQGVLLEALTRALIGFFRRWFDRP